MRTVLLACLVCAACASRGPLPEKYDWYAAASFSALPQVGAGLGAGTRVGRSEAADTFVEVEGVVQFLDDSDLADDGGPGPGTFTELRIGLKHKFSPQRRHRLTLRYGFVWFTVRGEPTVLDEPGDYVGGYVGVGFETDLSERWSMGPEVRALLVQGTGSQGFEFVPRFAWHFLFWF